MTCKHHYIRTWVFKDTEQPSGLWSCVDCSLKFEPITQRTWVDLTEEEIDDIYWQHESKLEHQVSIWPYERTIEAKLKEKNT